MRFKFLGILNSLIIASILLSGCGYKGNPKYVPTEEESR